MKMEDGGLAPLQLNEATGPLLWQPPCCGGLNLCRVYQWHHEHVKPIHNINIISLSRRAMEAAMGSINIPSFSELFVKSIWGVLGRSLPLYNPHIVIKWCAFSKLWIHYKHSPKVPAVFTLCELMQVENLSSEDQVWGNLLFMKSLLSNESVSNVDRWWNIHSLTVDHIRVLLFVSFCFPTLICLRYSFPGSLTNTHQL